MILKQSIIYQKDIHQNSDIQDFDKLIHTYDHKKQAEYITKLTQYAHNFLNDNFNIELMTSIKFNNRMKSSLGLTELFTSTNECNGIYLSGELFNISTFDDTHEYLYDTLKHELVHYALYILNKNYNDGSKDFEDTLKRLDIGSSGTTKNAILYKEYQIYIYAEYGIVKGYYKYDKHFVDKYNYDPKKIIVIKNERRRTDAI